MNSEYLPKDDFGKLAHLVEECGEVTAAVGKTLRFGLSSVNPEIPVKDRVTNREWLLSEIEDLILAARSVRKTLK